MYNIRLNEYTEYKLNELTRLRVLHRRFHQQENPCLPVSLPFVQNVRNLMTVMQFFPLFVTVSTRGVYKVRLQSHSSQLRLIPYLHHTSSVLRQLPLELLSEIFNEGGIKIISLSNIRPIIIYFHQSQCRLFPYLDQRPIFFKANSSIVAILELIRGEQCLIEVIRSSGEEM